MANKKTADTSAGIPAIVPLLVEVGGCDTVYADVYFRRARELLASVLPEAEYNALKGAQRDIDEAVKQSKEAAMVQDRARVGTLKAQVDGVGQGAGAQGGRRGP